MSANERVRLIRKELGITQEVLAAKLGIGKSALSMIETEKAALSERNKNIIVQELKVNPQWLESGQGKMFYEQAPASTFLSITDRPTSMQSVPLYNIEGMAGLVPIFTNQKPVEPIDYIHIPNLPRCDGAIYVVGDSMYPLLKSGDIVLYKQLNNIEDIFWGDIYLLSLDIDGEEYVMVKYVQKSEKPNYIKLVSENRHHADKDVPIDKVRALAFVKASIRMNTIR